MSTPIYFNSRPSARGDHAFKPSCFSENEFQFTPLREGRRALALVHGQLRHISIHAPPRGATSCVYVYNNVAYFNSRPSARGDMFDFLYLNLSTYFNSRPSARGDKNAAQTGKALMISIHAPPRGATFPFTNFHEQNLISIHAPPRGATETAVATDVGNSISIHAPPRGATRFGAGRRHMRNISIHAPPRGATGMLR